MVAPGRGVAGPTPTTPGSADWSTKEVGEGASSLETETLDDIRTFYDMVRLETCESPESLGHQIFCDRLDLFKVWSKAANEGRGEEKSWKLIAEEARS